MPTELNTKAPLAIESYKGQCKERQAFFDKFFPEHHELSSEESTGPTYSSGKSDVVVEPSSETKKFITLNDSGK